MRGHAWSNDIRDVVIRASQLGVPHTMTKAITGVSKRTIQRIVSEPKRGDDRNRRRRGDKVLDAKYYPVS